ncbi:hypothetical protein [Bacillus thuringiensis]|uniref:hypothetical protein n=1 Tax=Bacillus thuringiensis TaxID=1428 RepID=UPI0026E3C28C|nr:hypothetical protein [Bacillus thuringiensis]MDO6632875.1 hypothetical protein [Bacillus thuringiensis]MDO6662219.1 hypothetical protein [Bacillus thuringiensis]MDO6700913.1 hypothetical protein [Bacillus thuringiensis]
MSVAEELKVVDDKEATIQELANKIHHQKTKEYFAEVLDTFKNGNYRSTVVMLCTVVICDLFFKLKDLDEIHGDTKAQKILNDLQVEKATNPVSSDWENQLIDKAFKEAKLLENDVYTQIKMLKNCRNLCAHPVLNSLDILHRPNKETAESLIRNMLEGLLTKHPLFTKNVFVPFILEIERIQYDFPTQERLERYLESKFFVHFNKELAEHIFKNLWKFVFKSNGEREAANRTINFKVLLIIYNKYNSILLDYIEKNPDYFSDVLDKESVLNKLFDILSIHREIYPLFRAHTQETLKNHASKKSNWFIRSTFISESLTEHFKAIDSKIHGLGNAYNQPYVHRYYLRPEDVELLNELAKKEGVMTEFYDLMISHYYHSGAYSNSDYSFNICIKPFYEKFNREQIETLLKEVNSNPQCYEGWNGSKNKILLSTAKKLMPDIDVEEVYKNIF